MRIRQVKPAFWADSRLAELPERTRLFYIGLWMIADDAGWLRWDPVEVGRDLYGYESRVKRERRVCEMFAQLVTSERVVLHPCGHAEVPKLGTHQHLASLDKQVRGSLKEHLSKCSPQSPAETRGNPRTPGEITLGNGKGTVGRGKVGNGSGRASATTDPALLDSFRRQGLPVDVVS
jgi:hypothetical protein